MIRFIRHLFRRTPAPKPDQWTVREYERRMREIMERHKTHNEKLLKAGLFNPKRAARELSADLDDLSRELL